MVSHEEEEEEEDACRRQSIKTQASKKEQEQTQTTIPTEEEIIKMRNVACAQINRLLGVYFISHEENVISQVFEALKVINSPSDIRSEGLQTCPWPV